MTLRILSIILISGFMLCAGLAEADCDVPEANAKAFFELLGKPATNEATLVKFLQTHKFHSFPVNELCETPILTAVRLDRQDLLAVLSAAQGQPKIDMPQAAYADKALNDSIYSYSLRKGSLKIIRLLKSMGAGNLSVVCRDERDYPNLGVFPKGCTDLQIASSSNTADVIQSLIDEGRDVNAKNSQGETALMYAGHNQHPDVVTALLQAHADPKATAQSDFTVILGPYHHIIPDESVLMFAAGQGAPAESIAALLQADPESINATSKTGETALMMAGLGGAKGPVIMTLLQAGANVNAQTKDGYTALIMAGLGGAPADSINELLKASAEIDAVNTDGDSALMLAVKNNAPAESIQALLDAHANVNLVNKAGVTALMNSTWSGSEDLVKALIQAGAKLDTKDKNGKTALDDATLAKRPAAIIDLLKPSR